MFTTYPTTHKHSQTTYKPYIYCSIAFLILCDCLSPSNPPVPPIILFVSIFFAMYRLEEATPVLKQFPKANAGNIEIGEIDISLAEIRTISEVKVEDAPSRARMIVRGGDILISTTRPNRGAIVEIENGEKIFIASTGFAIIRRIVTEDINQKFLLYILRQSISLKQMEQRSSGGNYPAITQEELQNLLIPIPPIEKQLEIVDRITTIRTQAKQLRQAAAAKLEQAKQEVEAMILGES